eukprot:TRINITY_DN31274_c0_g1_i1.p1 TRINITY_DN31274_c0_g1~~TRINITY_DN31274_c0_g1_i1.p1  ORF type:complete len:119 (+),score=4.80 TRINITY_DN31274_c0_g1_i1:217-573(+)
MMPMRIEMLVMRMMVATTMIMIRNSLRMMSMMTLRLMLMLTLIKRIPYRGDQGEGDGRPRRSGETGRLWWLECDDIDDCMIMGTTMMPMKIVMLGDVATMMIVIRSSRVVMTMMKPLT